MAPLERTWAAMIACADHLTDVQRHGRVDGEWSLVETLRHLLFAMDKGFTAPILGEGFHPIGIPNSGSSDFPWPDLDRDTVTSYEEVLTARAERAKRFGDWLEELGPADLGREVTVQDCMLTVLEEEFEHHRYAVRDLAAIEATDRRSRGH
jgi:DinB family protein